MITIQNPHFQISQISDSGQCFRMRPIEDGRYSLVAKDRYLEISQKQDRITFSCSPQEYEEIWEDYFDLKTDYGAFLREIDRTDIYLAKAAEFGCGIRILKQDLWEMIISFLISQQNNIKRIRRCIELICERYGEERQSENGIFYHAFPTIQALAESAEEDLRACNLGYRARYLKRSAQSILNGEADLEAVRKMPYPQAREALMKLTGVGGKVADCICLFALHQLEAFPVDTHIRQAMERQYPAGFPHEVYGDCGGVMQQYIFFYELKGNPQRNQ